MESGLKEIASPMACRSPLPGIRVKEKGGYVDVKVEGHARLRLHTDSTLGSLIFYQGFEQNERAFLCATCGRVMYSSMSAPTSGFSPSSRPNGSATGQDLCLRAGYYAAAKAGREHPTEPICQCERPAICPVRPGGQFGDFRTDRRACARWSSLAAPIAGTGIQANRIEAVRWDDFARGHGDLKPTMMKIDVEGWENRVLDGASNKLGASDAPLLQVEFTDAAAHSAGSSCELYQHLLDLGYIVCRYDRVSNQLVPEGLRASYPYDNLYATKHLTADNARLGGHARTRWLHERLAGVLQDADRHAAMREASLSAAYGKRTCLALDSSGNRKGGDHPRRRGADRPFASSKTVFSRAVRQDAISATSPLCCGLISELGRTPLSVHCILISFALGI